MRETVRSLEKGYNAIASSIIEISLQIFAEEYIQSLSPKQLEFNY